MDLAASFYRMIRLSLLYFIRQRYNPFLIRSSVNKRCLDKTYTGESAKTLGKSIPYSTDQDYFSGLPFIRFYLAIQVWALFPQ